MADKKPAWLDLTNDIAEVRKIINYVWPIVGVAVIAALQTGTFPPSLVLQIVAALVSGVAAVFSFKTALAKGLFSLIGAALATLSAFITSDMDWSQMTNLNWLVIGSAIISSLLATFIPNKGGVAAGYDPGSAPSSTADDRSVLVAPSGSATPAA